MAAETSGTAVSVATAEAAGLLSDASNCRMFATIWTPATAAPQATISLSWGLKNVVFLWKNKIKKENLGNIKFLQYDNQVPKSDNHSCGLIR
jgi:hypothetical protein